MRGARLELEAEEAEAAVRALVHHGPGQKACEEVPDPEITDDGDAIVRVDARLNAARRFGADITVND